MILQGASPVCLVPRDDLPGFLTSGWARGLRDRARITQRAILSADFFPYNLTDARGWRDHTTYARCAQGLREVAVPVRVLGTASVRAGGLAACWIARPECPGFDFQHRFLA